MLVPARAKQTIAAIASTSADAIITPPTVYWTAGGRNAAGISQSSARPRAMKLKRISGGRAITPGLSRGAMDWDMGNLEAGPGSFSVCRGGEGCAFGTKRQGL